MTLPNIPKKLHEIKKIFGGGWGRGHAPGAPPISANCTSEIDTT